MIGQAILCIFPLSESAGRYTFINFQDKKFIVRVKLLCISHNNYHRNACSFLICNLLNSLNILISIDIEMYYIWSDVFLAAYYFVHVKPLSLKYFMCMRLEANISQN